MNIEIFDRAIKGMADCLAGESEDDKKILIQSAILDVWKTELKPGELEKLTDGLMCLINKELRTENEDDEIMVAVIDSSLEYLDEHCDYFSEPIKVSDMRKWLRDKFPSKFNTSEIKESKPYGINS